MSTTTRCYYLLLSALSIIEGVFEEYFCCAVVTTILISTTCYEYYHRKEKNLNHRRPSVWNSKVLTNRNGIFLYSEVSELKIGDVVLLSAGCNVPCRCIVLNGNAVASHTTVDELGIAESCSNICQEGDTLHMDMFVCSGEITARVTDTKYPTKTDKSASTSQVERIFCNLCSV